MELGTRIELRGALWAIVTQKQSQNNRVEGRRGNSHHDADVERNSHPRTHLSLSLSLSLSFSLPLFLFPFLKLGGSHVFLCTSPLFFLPFRIDAAEKAKNLSRATEKKEEDNIGGNPRCSIANLSRLPKRPTDRTPPHRPEHADTTPTGAKHTQTLCLYSNETAHRRLPSRFL